MLPEPFNPSDLAGGGSETRRGQQISKVVIGDLKERGDEGGRERVEGKELKEEV